MIKAVIFDMDGVLVDSEVEYARGTRDLLETYGYVPTDAEIRSLGGASRENAVTYIAEKLGMSYDEADALEADWFVMHPVDYGSLAKKGAVETLRQLHEAGLKLAVASSSPKSCIVDAMEKTDLAPYLDFVLSGEECTAHKPDPEIYRRTLELLEEKAEDVWVVEDSPYGIAAAKGAGLSVLGLYDPATQYDVTKADHVIHSLPEVSLFI